MFEIKLIKDFLKKRIPFPYFANTKSINENTYSSVSNSRLFGLTTCGNTLEEAKQKVYNAIKGNIDSKLDYRKDIGNIYEH